MARPLPLLLLLTACGGGATEDTPRVDDEPDIVNEDLAEVLSARGEYAVGYREEEVVYRDEVTATDRTLRLAIWYPSTDPSGEPMKYQGVFDAPDVWLWATQHDTGYPLVVFSHGHQGYAEASGFLMAHLASHGFAVAAPDHTGNTSFDSPLRETEIYAQRQLDISAVIDHMEADRVIGMGHSFGGYTLHALMGARYDERVLDACTDGSDTSEFCSTWTPELRSWFEQGFHDDRVIAGISMAAGDFRLFAARGVSRISAPTLIMAAEHDGHTPETAEPMWEVVQGGVNRFLYIAGGGHQTYTDFAGVLPDGSTIDPEEGKRIVAAYATAFALRHGPGDASVDPILDGDQLVSEMAEIRR